MFLTHHKKEHDLQKTKKHNQKTPIQLKQKKINLSENQAEDDSSFFHLNGPDFEEVAQSFNDVIRNFFSKLKNKSSQKNIGQDQPKNEQKKLDQQENQFIVKKPEKKPEKRVVKKIKKHVKSRTILSSGERGIDVSQWQGRINWRDVKVKGHIQFAFIKATQGTSFIDPEFERNWVGSGKAGIKRGAYCFFDPNENPIAQAKFFIKHAHKGELPPVLDLEQTQGLSSVVVERNALAWLKYIEQHFEKPILYTYSSFGDSFLKNKEFESYPLWIADYSSHPQVPATWRNHYAFWQFGQESVPGISGKVDRDVSH